jgi:hypothetical protein
MHLKKALIDTELSAYIPSTTSCFGVFLSSTISAMDVTLDE